MSNLNNIYVLIALLLIAPRMYAQQALSQLYKNAVSANFAGEISRYSYQALKPNLPLPVLPAKNIPSISYNTSLVARKPNMLSSSASGNYFSPSTYSNRATAVQDYNIIWSVKRLVVNLFNGIPINNKWYFMMDQYHIFKFATGKTMKFVFGLCPNAGPPVNACYSPPQF